MTAEDGFTEQTAKYEAMLIVNRYMANFGEMRRGIEGVLLPLGSKDAIERLMRDLVAFGYGMGDEPHRAAEWMDRVDAAQNKLRDHFAFLAAARMREVEAERGELLLEALRVVEAERDRRMTEADFLADCEDVGPEYTTNRDRAKQLDMLAKRILDSLARAALRQEEPRE